MKLQSVRRHGALVATAFALALIAAPRAEAVSGSAAISAIILESR